jgi:hypothetical protein
LGIPIGEGQRGLGIQDNFFDLGGTSLSAGQVISKIREVFQVDIPQIRFFEYPTIVGQGSLIDRALEERANSAETGGAEDLGKWLNMLESF